MLDNFPTNLHPMSQFSAAITALNSESGFARAYSEGVHKSKYWEVGFPTASAQLPPEQRGLFPLMPSVVSPPPHSLPTRTPWT